MKVRCDNLNPVLHVSSTPRIKDTKIIYEALMSLADCSYISLKHRYSNAQIG